MNDNKKAKEELIRRYGAECFIEKLKLRKDDEPRRYKSRGQKTKMKQLTYHHIKMKKNGGKANVENGALLSTENHAWFHKQSLQEQKYMNAMFQEYKKRYKECQVVLVDDLKMDFEIRAMEFHIGERDEEIYNRAKEKREVKKQIDEELER